MLETYEKFKIPYSITRKYIQRNIYNIVTYFFFSIYAEKYKYGEFKYKIFENYYNLNNFFKFQKNEKIKLFCVNDENSENDITNILAFKNKMEILFPNKIIFEV